MQTTVTWDCKTTVHKALQNGNYVIRQYSLCVCVSPGSTLCLSGIDLLDGTPVIDVKPYIPEYDSPNALSGTGAAAPSGGRDSMVETATSQASTRGQGVDVKEWSHQKSHQTQDGVLSHLTQDGAVTSDQKLLKYHCSETERGKGLADCRQNTQAEGQGSDLCQAGRGGVDVRVADWIKEPPIPALKVTFTAEALSDLNQFDPDHSAEVSSLCYLGGQSELRRSIESILRADPRSAYRRRHCGDRLYYFTVDTAHVTCWFYKDMAQVLRVQPHQPQSGATPS